MTTMTHESLERDVFVLGLSGSAIPLHDAAEDWPNGILLSEDAAHDSAAVLVANGEVVFGIEEERINRLKHCNRLASHAIELCLTEFARRRGPRSELHVAYYSSPASPAARERMVALIGGMAARYGLTLPPASIHLVGHHFCHAASAFLPSPFTESLILTVDGQGDGVCATVGVGRGSRIETLKEVPWQNRSLGYLYEGVTRFLGFGAYDEYKVMGLAPYGDAARYRDLMRQTYALLPDGEWEIHLNELNTILRTGFGPARKPEQPTTQDHIDLAAALQQALEEILLHILAHYRALTGQKNLCMAGGVALNCTANSRILRSGLFEDVFVQPAAHDGGGAYGAALATWSKLMHARPSQALDHLYWGRDVDAVDAGAELRRWGELLETERCGDIFTRTAELLADGKVVGWIGGRSEFGPRALGNRSIIADPRPASHKDLINAMVKKREAFRPFAPAVAEEVASAFFDIPEGGNFPWMIFVTDVKPEQRALLGAITHVDGSARVQTVSARSNPRFHRLLQAFGQQTGTPVLLNTSFNNNAEPIVDTVEDAIVCFLTTGLNYLVVGDYLVRKKALTPALLGELVPSLPAYLQITETTQYASDGRLASYATACNRYYAKKRVRLSTATVAALKRADGRSSLAELLGPALAGAFDELQELWSERLVTLRPRMRAARLAETAEMGDVIEV